MIPRLFRSTALLILLLWTLILNLYHAGVYVPPRVDFSEKATGEWFDRRSIGINHLVLQGPPFARGRLAGELTGHLLKAQEEQLFTQLEKIIPSRILIQGMVLSAIAWFQGVQKYIPREDVEEMYGVSLSAPKSFDFLADGFTRQLAYHGLHEVGQMMVDQGFEDMGCTVVAIPFKNQFVLGRNFDFEGGRIFDTEKIVKWVFPEKGNSYVSVTWAGMVGAVTGVNDHGLYASLNAAGSSDTKRLGTPTTLVLLKILEEANSAADALKILEQAQTFITDIFVIMDASGQLLRVEKSPARMGVVPLQGPSVIANHLISPDFQHDKTNRYRIEQLTSAARERRGRMLLREMPAAANVHDTILQVLGVLRDKGVDSYGQMLNLGHRRAIDALIATHSVILNPVDGVFYVSQGPAVAGPFVGYDLKESFRTHHPVQVDVLPADPLVTPEKFTRVKDAIHRISFAAGIIRKGRCEEGMQILEGLEPEFREQSIYYSALGDAQFCLGGHDEARVSWRKALTLNPAYERQEDYLIKRLEK